MLDKKYWGKIVSLGGEDAIEVLVDDGMSLYQATKEYKAWRKAIREGKINPEAEYIKVTKKYRKRIGNEYDKEICDRYIKGESLSQLADAYDTTEPSIRNILKRNDVPRRPKGNSTGHWLDEHIPTIRNMLSEGYTLKAIAQRFGVRPGTISYHLKINGFGRKYEYDRHKD